MSEERFRELAEHTAELFIFAKGEYTDGSGTKYPLPYCRQYNKSFPDVDLAICGDGISFTEAPND